MKSCDICSSKITGLPKDASDRVIELSVYLEYTGDYCYDCLNWMSKFMEGTHIIVSKKWHAQLMEVWNDQKRGKSPEITPKK